MADITHSSPVVTEDKLKDFYEDIKPFLGCPAYVTQEGNAEYYSTDEKVIGRWTDGKPLYQRTYSGTLANKTNQLIVDMDQTVYTIIYWMSYNNRPSTYEIYPLDGYTDNASYISTFVASDGLRVYSSVPTYISGKPFYAIVYYTKNNDSAVTTTEQKPTHYSTDEQVVGTWIDGRPVYQKVITKDSHVVPVNVETVVINTADLLDKTNIEVIDFHGCYYTDVGKAGEQLHQFTGKDGDYGYSAYYRQCDDAIKVYGNWGNLQYTVEKLKFFFQYVKKSDL